MQTIGISLLSFIVVLASCNSTPKSEKSITTPTANFINAPLKNVNIPFEEYTVEAGKGDTLFYKTGTLIIFPKNAFVDKDDKVIAGNVKIKYRELTNPVEYYLSGIPMGYDSAGITYNFESAGMCEILGFNNDNPVFVNQQSKPEIYLASQNDKQIDNLYYLDSNKKNWVNKGLSSAFGETKKVLKNEPESDTTAISLVQPIKPEKANKNNQIIKIEIDPASFKELLVYDNLRFEVVDDKVQPVNEKDADVVWSNVALQQGASKGFYTVTFSNTNRKVAYTVKPVLQGDDYDKAVKIFDKNNKLYQTKIKERESKEKIKQEKYKKDLLADTKMEEINKIIEKQNAIIELRNIEIERQNEIYKEQIKINSEAYLANKLMRSFSIDGFGIWNCDKVFSVPNIPISAIFIDANGNPIQLSNIAVLYKSINGIFNFGDNNIKVAKDAANMIIGINNGKLAYLTYNNYSKLKINIDSKEQTFTMAIVDEKNNNYAFIKNIALQP